MDDKSVKKEKKKRKKKSYPGLIYRSDCEKGKLEREIRRIKRIKKRDDGYKPAYCQKLIEHMSTGLSFSSFAAVVGATQHYIYSWLKAYPDFLVAKEQGQAASQMYWEKLGRDYIISTNKQSLNMGVWKYFMMCRFGKKIKDVDEDLQDNWVPVAKEEVQHSGGVNFISSVPRPEPVAIENKETAEIEDKTETESDNVDRSPE